MSEKVSVTVSDAIPTCKCCGYEGDSSNLKNCPDCDHLFCDQCQMDHPCINAKKSSNS